MSKREHVENTMRTMELLENALGANFKLTNRYEPYEDIFCIYVHNTTTYKYWLYEIDWNQIEITPQEVVDYLITDYRRRVL